MFDELMHLVARTQKLCCSPMVLEFLGVRKPDKPTHETITVSDELFSEKKAEEVSARCFDNFLRLKLKSSLLIVNVFASFKPDY